MPVYRGKPYQADTGLPDGADPEQTFFHLRASGETYTDYEAYLASLRLKQSRVWSCLITGQKGLTYEEAARAELRAGLLVDQFPPELEEPFLRLAHHSTLQLEPLIDAVFEAHCQGGAYDEAEDAYSWVEPVPRPVMRCWLFKVTDQELRGHRCLWRAKPQLAERYGLPAQPEAPADDSPPGPLQGRAAFDVFEGSLPDHPRKRTKRKVECDFVAGEEEIAEVAGEDSEDYEEEHDDRDTPELSDAYRSLEEEEARFRPGTNKFVAFAVLKGAGSEGLSVPEIMDAARELGLKEYGEESKRIIQFALASDSAFVRIRKGVYALRALVGDAPYASIGRPPKPRKALANGCAHGVNRMLMAAEENMYGDGEVASSSMALENGGDEAGADNVARAQRIAARVKHALEEHKQHVIQAGAGVVGMQERVRQAEARCSQTTPTHSAEQELGPMPNFELAEEEKAFVGDEADRRAVMTHKKRVAALQADLDAQREAWLRKQAAARDKDMRSSGTREVLILQRQLKRAEREAETARSEVESAEQALAEATRNIDRERARKYALERRGCADGRFSAREERERRRAEAQKSKRYPIDDGDLLYELICDAADQGLPPPREDVPVPSEVLSPEDADALATLLYVADFIAEFKDKMGQPIAPITYPDLVGLLGKGKCVPGRESENRQPLWTLYLHLIMALLQGLPKLADVHWRAVVNAGTWPEVLHRYIACKRAAEAAGGPALISEEVLSACETLAVDTPEALSPAQHRALLRYLCDECLDGETLRAALQLRIDATEEVRKEMRVTYAHFRSGIKELQGQEREERKRRKVEETAHRAEQRPDCASDAQPSALQNGGTPEPMGELPEGEDGVKIKEAAPLKEEEEPSWELPPELREFSGDLGDRRAAMAFTRAQNAARKKVDGEKNKWRAAQRRRQKAAEAARPKPPVTEELVMAEIAVADEEIARRQEEYDREMEMYILRREPLGRDREFRRYWWGIGGMQSGLYVEDEAAQMAVWRRPEDVDALIAALDRRGVRELALAERLEKERDAMVAALSGEARLMEDVQLANGGLAEPSSVLDNGDAHAGHGHFAGREKGGAQPHTLRDTALRGVAASLSTIQRSAASVSAPAPPDGWAAWLAAISMAGLSALKEQLQAAELLMQGTPGVGPYEAPPEPSPEPAPSEALEPAPSEAGDADGSSVAADDAEPSVEPAEPVGPPKPCLWGSPPEREAWLLELEQARTASAVAYAATRLERAVEALVQALTGPPSRKPRDKGRKSSGGGGRKGRR